MWFVTHTIMLRSSAGFWLRSSVVHGSVVRNFSKGEKEESNLSSYSLVYFFPERKLAEEQGRRKHPKLGGARHFKETFLIKLKRQFLNMKKGTSLFIAQSLEGTCLQCPPVPASCGGDIKLWVFVHKLICWWDCIAIVLYLLSPLHSLHYEMFKHSMSYSLQLPVSYNNCVLIWPWSDWQQFLAKCPSCQYLDTYIDYRHVPQLCGCYP